jgi:ribosomal protein S18 acetylase RimI-like enzyme
MFNIRPLIIEDRLKIKDLLEKTGFFSRPEIAVAMELIDIFLSKPDQKDYSIYVVEETSSRICGYICYGPTPLTEGTYDLYWIAVDPEFQNKGIGKKLIQFLERQIDERQGRLIIVETSAQIKYESTQAFYLNNNYQLSARIKDFYKPGDDRLIYTKYIH